jgi:hypothetical protein
MKNPKAVIVGPAERIDGWPEEYVPRIMYPPCRSAESRFIKGGVRMSEEECNVLLDREAEKAREDGYRVIRVHTMEERDAILTFVREAAELTIAGLAGSVSIYAHEREEDKPRKAA